MKKVLLTVFDIPMFCVGGFLLATGHYVTGPMATVVGISVYAYKILVLNEGAR